jgi:hypothetical protein
MTKCLRQSSSQQQVQSLTSILTITALDDSNNQWNYCPSVPLAAIFAILFAITLLCHLFQVLRHRQAFCWVIILGALSETCAFAFRVLSAKNPTHKGSYDASFLLVLLAPLAINAFDYMLLGRLVRRSLPDGSRIFGVKGSMMGILFVCSDVMLVHPPCTGFHS